MSRLTVKKRDELNDVQREQFDRIASFRSAQPDGTLGGPFDPWVRSPELARRAIGMGNFLWERTSLERRIVELVICVTARFWESNVEWVAHARAALQHGVAQQTLDAIMAEQDPRSAPTDEQLANAISSSLHRDHRLPRKLYDRAIETFGEQGLAELIGVIGYYTLVSMTLNAFEIPALGVEQPFTRSSD